MSATGAAGELDPRVERSRLVIRRAALDELGAVGYGAFTIESVAAGLAWPVQPSTATGQTSSL